MKESRRLQIKLGVLLFPLIPVYCWLCLWLVMSRMSQAVEDWNNGWANKFGEWLADHGYPLEKVDTQLRAARYKENRVEEEVDHLHR